MRQIQLTQNKVALIDDEDYVYIDQFKWYTAKDKHGKYYARRSITVSNRVYKKITMHRDIMSVSDPKIQVDHKDNNGLNNQKENLRLCNNAENSRNTELDSLNTSGFKGVDWHEHSKKWRATIRVDYKKIHLGFFSDVIDAALAYNKAAIEYFGEFAKLNNKPPICPECKIKKSEIYEGELGYPFCVECATKEYERWLKEDEVEPGLALRPPKYALDPKDYGRYGYKR